MAHEPSAGRGKSYSAKDELVKALRHLVDTPLWLSYSTERSSQPERDLLLSPRYEELFRALAPLSPTWSFTAKVCADALCVIAQVSRSSGIKRPRHDDEHAPRRRRQDDGVGNSNGLEPKVGDEGCGVLKVVSEVIGDDEDLADSADEDKESSDDEEDGDDGTPLGVDEVRFDDTLLDREVSDMD